MVTNKRSRDKVDDIAADVLDYIIRESGMNNLSIDKATNSAIGYNRVRDIRNKLKAPVRLSEFLLICDACKTNPIETLGSIIKTSQRSQKSTQKFDISQLPSEERGAMAVEEFTRNRMTAAADADPNKEIEMNGDAEDF